mmetsp:Transcript_21115/g.59029  ORF Transcript_21115/g.59029 Transcript_21115/m.59029 type:complete len:303 (-) Transcript_21115:162-1070(-)
MGQSMCQRRAAAGEQESSKAATVTSQGLQSNSAAEQRVGGKTAEEWKSVGNEAVKQKDYAAAYDAYSKGLRAEPDHAMILSNRALCLEKLGRLEEAVADSTRCTVLRPDFVKAFIRAATLLQELRRPQEAFDVLQEAPQNAEITQLLAKLPSELSKSGGTPSASLRGAERLKEEGNELFKKGFFEKALEVYVKALKACSKDPKGELAVAIHNNCAGCYQQLSDFRAVVKETNFVLERQPDNIKALVRRMLAFEPLEKYEEALADARHVIRLAPGNEAANRMQHRLGKLVRDRERGDPRPAGA